MLSAICGSHSILSSQSCGGTIAKVPAPNKNLSRLLPPPPPPQPSWNAQIGSVPCPVCLSCGDIASPHSASLRIWSVLLPEEVNALEDNENIQTSFLMNF